MGKGNHDWVNTLPANGYFRCIKPDRWTRRHPSRQMDHIIARKTSGHPSRVPPSPSRCLVDFGTALQNVFHGLFTRWVIRWRKKRRDGRAFRGRRSGVYVIAGWWTLVYLRKRAKQAPFLLLALSSSHYPSSLSLIKAAPLFIKFHERNRVTCNRGGKKKMKKRLRSEQPLRDWALKNVDDKKVLASFVYFFRNETSFREITREIFLLGLMFNEMSFSINMYVQFGLI